jgi:hypothetical protein
MISNWEKKRRQHERELKSFKNKMGVNIVWFESLHEKSQYDLLFSWKKEKNNNRLDSPKKIKIKYGGHKIDSVKYPASLKYFIKKTKNSRKYKPNKDRLRDAALEIILQKN